MRRFIITILFFTLTIYNCYAAGPWTNGASILRQGVGARPLGMGEAFVGLADDINTLQFNPAGLSNLSNNELGAVYSKGLADTSYSNMAYAQPLGEKGYIGGSFLLFQGGDIEINWWDSVNGVRTETRNAKKDYVLTLGYAQDFMSEGELSAGANLKYVSSKLAEESTASSIAVDLGGLYRLLDNKLSLGLSIQNIGTALKYKGGISSGSEADPLPLGIRVGGAYVFISDDSKELTGVLDINKYSNTDMQLNLGLECWLKEMIALRAGYEIGYDLASITAGLGFKVKNCQLDYGFSPMSEINAIHKVSFILRFGESSEESDEEEAVAAPVKKSKPSNIKPDVSIKKSKPSDAKSSSKAEQKYQRGLIYFNAEEYELAIAEFEGTIALNPDNQEATAKIAEATEKLKEQTYQQGLEYFNKGKYKNAKVQFEKVIDIDPSNQEAQQKLNEIKDLLKK
ncbi:MAG: PorV/PorQ family protein [Elusimicrobia bacterium]|nr:PorV/PorQ family protein [Elusimicrobiota bacterium]